MSSTSGAAASDPLELAELFTTGVVMGIIHVLTGPDHLSALATLCGSRIYHTSARCNAFLLGVRWGVGHSLGLLMVGGTLIAIEESSAKWIAMDPTVCDVLEGFVGVFMLGLGAYGIARAERNRAESAVNDIGGPGDSSGEDLKLNEASGRGGDDDGGDVEMPPQSAARSPGRSGLRDSIVGRMEEVLEFDKSESDRHVSISGTEHSLKTVSTGLVPDPADDAKRNAFQQQQRQQQSNGDGRPQVPTRLLSATSLMNNHTGGGGGDEGYSYVHGRLLSRLTRPCRDDNRRRWWFRADERGRHFTPGALALAAGVLHGVAGPGGVLGVIPAVQLKDARLASAYLITFCVTSTLVMGGFAAFYGTLSEWLAGGRRVGSDGIGGGGGDRVYMVEIGSALLSLCVGVIWLVLLSLGKLGDVFP